MPEQIAVQIVGPKLLRQAIGALLRTYRDIVIIDPEEQGIEFVKRHAPDALLVIAVSPGRERLGYSLDVEAVPPLPMPSPSFPVDTSHVALLMVGDEREVISACSHGTQVLLSIDDDAGGIHWGILAAAKGEPYCTPALSQCLVRALQLRTSPRLPISAGSVRLSDREREVARLAAFGYSNEEIAQQLHISQRTVKAHLTEVFRKLDIKRRGQINHRVYADRPHTATTG